MKKLLINFLGVSTVGKTTLAEDILLKSQAMPIPVVSVRNKRDDDNDNLIVCMDEREFKEQRLLLGSYQEGYGFRCDEFENFLKSDLVLGISVMTFSQSIELKEKLKQSKDLEKLLICNVLIRFSDNLETDKKILAENLSGNFKNRDHSAKRLKLHTYLLEKYAFNPVYLNNYVDIILKRDQGNVQEMSKFLCATLSSRLQGKSIVFSNNNQKSRED